MFCKLDLEGIFDLSGGDLANTCISFIDFKAYQNGSACFYGYSDLSVVLNALYSKTKKKTCLFQLRNNLNIEDTQNAFKFTWLKKKNMKGIVIGGNIRCFLKLAGTSYFLRQRIRSYFRKPFRKHQQNHNLFNTIRNDGCIQ